MICEKRRMRAGERRLTWPRYHHTSWNKYARPRDHEWDCGLASSLNPIEHQRLFRSCLRGNWTSSRTTSPSQLIIAFLASQKTEQWHVYCDASPFPESPW